jgi:hypothetical protein
VRVALIPEFVYQLENEEILGELWVTWNFVDERALIAPVETEFRLFMF